MARERPYAIRSWSGGILAPVLYARGDTANYAFGAKDILNAFVTRGGAVANRSGTRFIAEVKDSSKATRIIPWIFDNDDRYAIEMGEGYFRFYQDGARIVVSGVAAYVATTYYEPGDIVSNAGTNWYAKEKSFGVTPAAGDYWHALTSTTFEVPNPYTAAQVFDVRAVQLNDVTWLVHPSHPIYELTRYGDTDWTMRPFSTKPPLDGPAGIATSSTGSAVTDRYKVTSVKKETLEESLPGHIAPLVLSTGDMAGGSPARVRILSTGHALIVGNDVYVVDVFPVTGTPNAAFEAALEGKVFNVGAINAGVSFDLDSTTALVVPAGYRATVIQVGTAAAPYGALIGGATEDIQPNAVAHGLATGDEILVIDVVVTLDKTPCTNAALVALLKGKTWKVTVIDVDNFSLDDSDGITLGGAFDIIYAETAVTDTHGATDDVTLTWNAVPGAEAYYVYKEANGVFGFIGTAIGTTFVDEAAALEPDSEDVPPAFLDPWRKASSYPSSVGLHKERLIFAGSTDEPSRFWMSRIGDFRNFTHRSPLQDDDAVTGVISGAGRIKHIRDMDTLVMLAEAGIWFVYGDADGVIRPTAINAKKRGNVGSGDVTPMEIDDSLLYVESRASVVRDFRIDAIEFKKGRDLTTYASHLFDGLSIVDAAYQRIANSMGLWVRSDGVLLMETYVREQEINAWTRSVTGTGIDFGFESAAVIPDDGEDRVYSIVRRTVNGSTERYVEYFTNRKAGHADYDLVDDAFFVDSGLTYDGRNTSATTFTLSAGPPWTAGSTLTLTASAATFPGTGANVGKRYKLYVGSEYVHVDVTVDGSTTIQTVTCVEAVPVALRGVATLVWSAMVMGVSGLGHLEARTLNGLADGIPFTGRSVTTGAITLSSWAEYVVAGLPYVTDIETLDLDTPTSAVAGQDKVVPELVALVNGTIVDGGVEASAIYGPRVGPDSGNLTPLFQTPVQATDHVTLFSGKAKGEPIGEFNNKGSILIRHTYPLPMLVEGLMLAAATES